MPKRALLLAKVLQLIDMMLKAECVPSFGESMLGVGILDFSKMHVTS